MHVRQKESARTRSKSRNSNFCKVKFKKNLSCEVWTSHVGRQYAVKVFSMYRTIKSFVNLGFCYRLASEWFTWCKNVSGNMFVKVEFPHWKYLFWRFLSIGPWVPSKIPGQNWLSETKTSPNVYFSNFQEVLLKDFLLKISNICLGHIMKSIKFFNRAIMLCVDKSAYSVLDIYSKFQGLGKKSLSSYLVYFIAWPRFWHHSCYLLADNFFVTQPLLPPFGSPYAPIYSPGGVYSHPSAPIVSQRWHHMCFNLIFESTWLKKIWML